MRLGFVFLQRSVQRWQDHPWRHHDAVCPYNIGHARTTGKLEFVCDAWFKKYVNGPAKMRKLYWKLHGCDFDGMKI